MEDVWEPILLCLPLKDYVTAGQTSHLFHTIVEKPSSWLSLLDRDFPCTPRRSDNFKTLYQEAFRQSLDPFTKAQKAEFREAFSLFDRDGSGVLHGLNTLGTALRALGNNPSQQELQTFLHPNETATTFSCDFERFTQIMKHFLHTSPEQDLADAFKVFDPTGSGFISSTELRIILTSLGESLTNEEVDEMIREVEIPGTGQISLQSLSAILM